MTLMPGVWSTGNATVLLLLLLFYSPLSRTT